MTHKPLTLEDLHDVQLDMMIKLDTFCNTHKIQYSLADGTLLGAIRHKGFILWDDDVDIYMPRDDYERFIQYEEISSEYKIVSHNSHKEYYHPFTYCNVTDSKTVMIENLMSTATGKGVFLDIFPLDGLPDEKINLYRHLRKLQFMNFLLCYSNIRYPKITNLKQVIKACAMVYCHKFIIKEKQIMLIENLAKKYSYLNSTYVSPCSFLPIFPSFEHFIFRKENFNIFINHSFENVYLKIPIGYHSILSTEYGDYMTPPPPEKQTGHHEIIYKWRK